MIDPLLDKNIRIANIKWMKNNKMSHCIINIFFISILKSVTSSKHTIFHERCKLRLNKCFNIP